MSLFNWVRYTAIFLDVEGKVCGQKIIKRSMGFTGLKEQTFTYEGGLYNVKPKAFRAQIGFKSHLFFDDDIFIYIIGNPDPLEYKYEEKEFKPVMDAEVYRVRMENKLVVDLNKAALGGLDIPNILKWVGLGILIFIVIYFFMSKGNTTPAETIVQNVTTTANVVRGGVVRA